MTSMINKKLAVVLPGVAAAAIIGCVAGVSGAADASPAVQAASSKAATVYQAEKVNQHIVLGPQSSPTRLTQTAPLPAGTYLVTAIVGAVISSHDQIVCAANLDGGNDGVFGTAGNPGTGGIYGTATMTDTVVVPAGESIEITCNSFNYGLGTYASTAVIEAQPVTTVVRSS